MFNPGIGAGASVGMPGIGASIGAMGAATAGNSVVLCSNIPEERGINCDMLFTLFGVYGDVMRVKISYQKRSTALIQYRDPGQAQQAAQFLDSEFYHLVFLLSYDRR